MAGPKDVPTGPKPHERAMTMALQGHPDWNPNSRPGETTIEAEAAIVLLSGDAPWLPGAAFAADPLLAPYLRSCLRRYTPERRDNVLAALKAERR